MKRIVFRLNFIFILFLTFFLFTKLNVGATTIAEEMGFSIPKEMTIVKESEQNNYKVKYNKNYWTAHNKGVYECANFCTWQGIYQYYEEKTDTLYIFLTSFSNTSPLDQKISVAPTARVRNKAIYQSISVSQGSLNSSVPTILLGYSPVNKNGQWTETIGFTIDSEGYIQPSYSIYVTHDDVEWKSNGNKEGLEVNYNYTRHTSSNDGIYTGSNIHLASYYFCIKNAKSHVSKTLNFAWDYRAEYYIDDAGWENYNASTSDSTNQLSLKETFNYTVKL